MRSPSPASAQERVRQIHRRRANAQARDELARYRIREYWVGAAAPPFTAATASFSSAAAAASTARVAAAAHPCVPGATAAVAAAAAAPGSAESTAPAAATAADTTLSVAATAATATAAPATKFAIRLVSVDTVIDLEPDVECIDICTQLPLADTPFEEDFYQRADRADAAAEWRFPAIQLDSENSS